ncbi:hypothetical protein SUGI_0738040 [Cryptomeria japonica]|nr:hypothetical protein SUGI_0738040 [Cryptomeria japonica]
MEVNLSVTGKVDKSRRKRLGVAFLYIQIRASSQARDQNHQDKEHFGKACARPTVINALDQGVTPSQ